MYPFNEPFFPTHIFFMLSNASQYQLSKLHGTMQFNIHGRSPNKAKVTNRTRHFGFIDIILIDYIHKIQAKP